MDDVRRNAHHDDTSPTRSEVRRRLCTLREASTPFPFAIRNATGLKNPGGFSPHPPGDTQPRDHATARAADNRARRAERCPARLNRSAHLTFIRRERLFPHIISSVAFSLSFPLRPSSPRVRATRSRTSRVLSSGGTESRGFTPRFAFARRALSRRHSSDGTDITVDELVTASRSASRETPAGYRDRP